MDFGQLIRHPAVVTGLIRAVAALLISFGLQLTDVQLQAIIDLQTAAFIVISLVLTGVTVTQTQRKPAPADEVVVGPPEGNAP